METQEPKVEQQETENESTNSVNNTVGNFFKSKREEQKISQETIARNTKINVNMIKLLEQNCFDKMPNKIYIAGYVKSYAKELKLDVQKCLQLFERTYTGTSLPEDNSMANVELPTQHNATPFNVPPVIIIIVTVVALTAGTISFLYFKNKKDTPKAEAPKEEITKQILTAQTPLKEQPPIETKEGQKEQEITEIKVEKKPVEEVTEAKNKLESKLVKKEKLVEKKKEEKKEEKKITFHKTTRALFKKARNSKSKDASVKYLPKNIKNSFVSGNQNVFVNASEGDTWLTYKKDDRPIRKIFLKKGSHLLISGKSVRIFFGNVHASKVFLNGQLLETPSRSGVKSLIFPVEDEKKYSLPLFIFLDTGKVVTSDEYQKMTQ